jgi:hypothetical protein
VATYGLMKKSTFEFSYFNDSGKSSLKIYVSCCLGKSRFSSSQGGQMDTPSTASILFNTLENVPRTYLLVL